MEANGFKKIDWMTVEEICAACSHVRASVQMQTNVSGLPVENQPGIFDNWFGISWFNPVRQVNQQGEFYPGVSE